MRTVYHPTIPGCAYIVSDDNAPAWKDAGWRYTPPAAPTTGPAASPAATSTPSASAGDAAAPADGDTTATPKE